MKLSGVKHRCPEGWRLFLEIGKYYQGDRTAYDLAVAEHRVHMETCAECNRRRAAFGQQMREWERQERDRELSDV